MANASDKGRNDAQQGKPYNEPRNATYAERVDYAKHYNGSKK